MKSEYISYVICCSLLVIGCGKHMVEGNHASFTKGDSLTDRYLAYEEGLLQSWNVMINDDNQKIESLHNLLHEIMISNPEDHQTFASFEQRLNQLANIRFTQKSMENADIIEEYDLASHDLVNELTSLAENRARYNNSTVKKLIEEIRIANGRVEAHRRQYDSIVVAYNKFLDKNKNHLNEIDCSIGKKRHLFHTVSQ